jgi:two-component system, chemotaxis family, protein-glutamate methylesterase/glutaminase
MTDEKKIEVLIVEDSSVVLMLLVHILNSDPQIRVVGTAANGRDALQFLATKSPDIILMDVEMPEMDGFETTRRIMETQPVPIIICTGSSNSKETITAFRLMEAGAVACVEKPRGKAHGDYHAMAAHLLQTVKLMSEVKVVRRWRRTQGQPTRGQTSTEETTCWSSPARAPREIELIGIGASTGGPPVLQTILSALPKDFPVPLLIVQHIAAGFVAGLVEWLNQTTGLKVQVAAYGVQPLPGHVYLAPDDFHLAISAGGGIALSKAQPENGLRPAVAHLFRSLAEVCGSRAVGVLLTGMGKDGARELKELKDRGAFTIAQDRESSVIHGMPGEAIALGGAVRVLPADKIASALITQVNRAQRKEDVP